MVLKSFVRWVAPAVLVGVFAAACGGKAPDVRTPDEYKVETVADLKAKAAEAWRKRATKEGTQEAIDRLETVVLKDPNDVEARAELAHAYYWLGEVFETDEDAKIGLFEKGAEHGYKALEVDENYIPAVYWTAVCVGSRAAISSFVQKLRYARKAKALQEKVLEKDETFFHGGTHLFWGVFHVKADGLAGGTFEQSYGHFERAIEIEPNYLRSYYLYANWTLLSIKRKSPEKLQEDREKARVLLEKVLHTRADVLPDAVPENEVAKRQAKELYDQEFGAAASS